MELYRDPESKRWYLAQLGDDGLPEKIRGYGALRGLHPKRVLSYVRRVTENPDIELKGTNR